MTGRPPDPKGLQRGECVWIAAAPEWGIEEHPDLGLWLPLDGQVIASRHGHYIGPTWLPGGGYGVTVDTTDGDVVPVNFPREAFGPWEELS